MIWALWLQETKIKASKDKKKKITINNNKKKNNWSCKIVDFAVSADHWIKLKESEKKDKYLDLAKELKKTMEHESDVYINYNWCSWQLW